MELFLLAVAGSTQGALVVAVWNGMPARWLCDYGEAETSRHQRRQLPAVLWGTFFGAGFVFAGFYVFLREVGASGVSFGNSGAAKESLREAIERLMMSSMERALLTALSVMGILWFLLLIFMADRKYMVIPDQFTAGLAVWGAASAIASAAAGELTRELSGRLAAGLLCGGGFWILGGLAGLLTRLGRRMEDRGAANSFGFGDVKLIFTLGFLLGTSGGFFVLAAASMVCGLVLSLLLLAGRTDLLGEHPFGPYLCLTATVYLLSV